MQASGELMAEFGLDGVRVRGLTREAIWSKCAVTAASRSTTPDLHQRVASADHVDLFLSTNSKKVKR